MPETPITRREMYLAGITGAYGGDLPQPVTREEQYLYEIAINGTGGGGGSGGTTNYNALQNRPQINGVTLSGNKTTAQLGINATKDYTELQNIPTLNGHSIIGTLTSSDLEINQYSAMIGKPSINNVVLNGNLSLSDLGITSVTVDSALSATSTNPVQNKAVYAALSGKLEDADLDDLKSDIQANADAIDIINGTGDGSVQKQIATAIANISTLTKQIVTALPAIADAQDNVIYLLATETAGVYEQYTIVTNSEGSKILALLGSTQVDLTDYYNKTQIDNLLTDKVDKVTGKTLTSNDFTDALKAKLDGIEDGADKSVIDSALSSTSENAIQNQAVYEALEGKQASLTFDSTPTENSTNPVTSEGIYQALQNISVDTATVATTGVVKPDGTTITIDSDGTISSTDYTAGNGIDISDGEISAETVIFTGTQAEWEALTGEQKKSYTIANITDDKETDQVTDTVESGNMLAVTSNAVADYAAQYTYDSPHQNKLTQKYKITGQTLEYCYVIFLGFAGAFGAVAAIYRPTTNEWFSLRSGDAIDASAMKITSSYDSATGIITITSTASQNAGGVFFHCLGAKLIED